MYAGILIIDKRLSENFVLIDSIEKNNRRTWHKSEVTDNEYYSLNN